MRLTPKHVGMEISWGNLNVWRVFKGFTVGWEFQGVRAGLFYRGYENDGNWRVRKPQSKRRK